MHSQFQSQTKKQTLKYTPAEQMAARPYPSHAGSLGPSRSQQSRTWRALLEDDAVAACETSDLRR